MASSGEKLCLSQSAARGKHKYGNMPLIATTSTSTFAANFASMAELVANRMDVHIIDQMATANIGLAVLGLLGDFLLD